MFRCLPISRRSYGTGIGLHKFMSALPNKKPAVLTASDAVSVIKSDQMIMIQGTFACPQALISAMLDHCKSNKLSRIRLLHGLLDGPLYQDPEMYNIFRPIIFFAGPESRPGVNSGKSDYIPVFLSQVPLLFGKTLFPDVCLVHVTPADENGYHSLGVSVDFALHGMFHSKYLIAQVNHHMPWTYGQSMIHESHFHAVVHSDAPLPNFPPIQVDLTAAEKEIGKLIAENLVEDGATLQVGIGGIPDSVLSQLSHHRDLGVHTELHSDGVIDLIKSGVINNSKKRLLPGHVVTGILIGTKRLDSFANRNPVFLMRPSTFTNAVSNICQNPKVTAINQCLGIDLTGNVTSDMIGRYIYSGFGGQVDFLRGASLSEGGKPILAMTSTTSKGESKITAETAAGTSLTATRGHVDYIVTEYGIASLHGRNLRQRAHQLIRIAHPDHQQSLEKSAFQNLKCMPSPD